MINKEWLGQHDHIMRVLLDGQSLQVWQHLQDGERLAGMLGELSGAAQCSIRFTDVFDARALADTDILVIPTRIAPVGAEERDALQEYVERGGGLLLLTNHADWPGHNPHDFTKHDRPLAQLFGISIKRAWFRTRERHTCMFGDDLRSNHPILRALDHDGTSVERIVVNNSTAVTSVDGDVLVSLSDDMVDERSGEAPVDQAFAIAVSQGSGRVVVLADSGFIGSAGTMAPGPGLLDQGSNRLFLSNSIRWAARLL